MWISNWRVVLKSIKTNVYSFATSYSSSYNGWSTYLVSLSWQKSISKEKFSSNIKPNEVVALPISILNVMQ